MYWEVDYWFEVCIMEKFCKMLVLDLCFIVLWVLLEYFIVYVIVFIYEYGYLVSLGLVKELLLVC